MCTLRAGGADFDADSFVKTTTLRPSAIFRRGDPRRKALPSGARHAASSINVAVSDAPSSDLPAQVADAERFLTAKRDELVRLVSFPGVVEVILDFPIELRLDGEAVAVQFDRFPASLVRLAGSLGVGLELSTYPRSGDLRVEARAVEDALHPLRGLPLWDAGHAASMLWLQFGSVVSSPTSRNPDRRTGEYALHLQCPWRVSAASRLIAGSGEEAHGAANLATWLDAHRTDPVRVTAIAADACKGFRLALTHGYALDVFPESTETEQWRLLQPGKDAPHVVVGGADASI